ncbi:MAG: hypothetical protein JOZ38_09545 [Candidatus Eremiobacteraeota bacterium]|nr:hypothetical protein [Candidatus Eremiobacteraeota bacterium]
MRILVSALACTLALAPLAAAAQSPAPAASPSPAPAAPAPAAPAADNPKVHKIAEQELLAWENGKVDRSHYGAAANAQITDAMIQSVAAQMGPLGSPNGFTFAGQTVIPRVGPVYQYEATFQSGAVHLIESIQLDADGKVSYITFAPKS